MRNWRCEDKKKMMNSPYKETMKTVINRAIYWKQYTIQSENVFFSGFYQVNFREQIHRTVVYAILFASGLKF